MPKYPRGALCAAFVITAILAATAATSRAEVSFLPLPVFDTSRNGGNEYGFMPVWLLKEQSEYVYAIIAPSVIYNGNTGYNFTFRYLGFPTVDRNYRIFVNQSSKVDHEVTFEYWDRKFLGGRFRLTGRATFFRDSTFRFYGLGPKSRDVDETDYSNMEFAPEIKLGYYLPHNLELSYGERVRWVTIRRGTVASLPYINELFPKLEGKNGGAVQEHRVTLTYDTRDDEVMPCKGWLVSGYGELINGYTGGRLFTRAGFDAKRYIPSAGKRFVTVLKLSLQATGGAHVPFYEQASLGGENTLRGLGGFRYRDDNMALLNIEERIRLFRLHIFGVWSEWEAAPFVDAGKVFGSFRKDILEEIQVNPGVGFRAIVQPNVVGRVDIGYGHSGPAAFVGLDFPF